VHKMNPYLWSESAVRHKVWKIMKRRIPDRVWQYFVNRGAVGEVRQNLEEPAWLVGEIEKFLIAADFSSKAGAMLSPAETPRRQRRDKVVPARSDAVSEFIAERARDDEEVRGFRERYLSGAVLSPWNVEAWIDEQSSEYDHALVVRIPRGTQISPGPDGLPLLPELTSVKREQIEEILRVDCIAYQRPPSPWVHRKAIGRDGVLRTLLLLSRRLAKTFGWTEDQATMFVLTDLTPEIATARWGILPVAPLAWLTSVSLTVDLQITPEELAKKYRTIRSKILGPKHRSLGEKHCRLAVFALKHQDLNQDALREWNNRHPAWSYPTVSRFAKEARVAKQRQEELIERQPFHPAKLIQYFKSLETESTVNPASGPPAELNSGPG
jgi:hypothetical protein